MSLLQTAPSLAKHTCFPCRRSKRRCDRSLPACRLCVHKGVDCSYPTFRGQKQSSSVFSQDTSWNVVPTRVGSEISHSPSPQMEQASSASKSPISIIAAIQFLDPKLFHEAQLEIPRLETAIPSDVTAYLGNSKQIRDMSVTFFSSSASWLPIICRKRFFSMVLNPLFPPRHELVLLTLCMKLFCTPLPLDSADGQTVLYATAKRFYSEVEATGIMSVRVLQAALFIATYEIGHAIYPAAYYTVGACARYGTALGVDKLMSNLMGDGELGQSWIEIEEMRRVWWGVLILDRILNLGFPLRCLATKDPSFDDYLPVDDQLFFNGTTKPEDAVSIYAGFSLKMGIFARIAQATYLISQVLQSLASTQSQNKSDSVAKLKENTTQLRRTLEALVKATEKEVLIRDLAFCCQTTICYYGVLLLQDHYWQLLDIASTQDAYDNMFPETQPALDALWHMATRLRNQTTDGKIPDNKSTIFLMQIIYQATSIAISMGHGDPDGGIKEKIDTSKWLLRQMQARWRLGGVYLTILDAREAILTSKTL